MHGGLNSCCARFPVRKDILSKAWLVFPRILPPLELVPFGPATLGTMSRSADLLPATLMERNAQYFRRGQSRSRGESRFWVEFVSTFMSRRRGPPAAKRPKQLRASGPTLPRQRTREQQRSPSRLHSRWVRWSSRRDALKGAR